MGNKLLIAEDEARLREIISDYFKAKGFSVSEARNGSEALEILEDGEFDIILMDIMMPGTDGFSACRQIRKLYETPVIFITAKADEEDKLTGYGLGADDYITKPFSLPVLYAKVIAETAGMDKFVLEMLDLSKLEANVYKLKPEKISLKNITEKEIGKYKNAIEAKNVNLSFNCDKEYEIFADPTGIEFIISNFISNAVKHTPEGKNIDITIENNGKKTVFSIENQGENIPEDKVKKIWDSFYKVDDSRERKDGGTGLGLAIAKKYLELHKAAYGCENTKDGVKFWFSIK